ncbi:hypothetical protein NM688_g4597 [Phlebia brevispora]|uniref:Uncharacterized protein n=1 Tax=Phlebia brevispora TaxID=194682 RepID=A0ACC1T2M7_9APHY|nr:hypothetical protein NM688_g4597 [Phlebia brevispora]
MAFATLISPSYALAATLIPRAFWTLLRDHVFTSAGSDCSVVLGWAACLAVEMRSFIASVLLLVFSVSEVASLWPIPRSLSTGSTALKLSPTFDININVKNAPSDLVSAVARSKSYIQTDKMQRLVVGRGSGDESAVQQAHQLGSLALSLAPGAEVKPIAQEAIVPLGSRREEYVLHVPADGSAATLTANSTLGLLRGLTTFEQLWYDLDGQATYTIEAPISVTDSPAYPFRGFMLDTARNFFSVSDIKRTLDAMSWSKINQFHWHVVDSQSFPLQIPGFMDISAKGAYSSSMVYTPEDVQDIVTYAGERGIDVLIEIDTPGHTAIIHQAYPEHVACFEGSPWAVFANEPPAGQLRFASSNTTNFTTELLVAVAKMFPSSLISTGGDELNTECYADDAETQQILNSTGSTLEELLSTFTQTTHGALQDLGKTTVVWEEMVLDFNVTLANDTVVMVWISSEDAAAVAEKGFRLVHAPSDYFYLDCGAGEWLGSDPDAPGKRQDGVFSQAEWSWLMSCLQSYTFDPLANISEAQQYLVLGGQQLLWTEQSGPENLDSIAWPRAASSAEVFWTGATFPDGSPRNVTGALPRLHDLRFRMVQRGVNAIPLQPLWCALRPSLCNLNS